MSVNSTFLLSIYLCLAQVLTADAQDCPRPDSVYVLYAGTDSKLYELYDLNNEFPRTLTIDDKNYENDVYFLNHKGASEVFQSVSTDRYDISENELNNLNLFSVHDLYIKALEIRKCVFDAAKKGSGVYPYDDKLWYFDNIFLIIQEDERLVTRKVIWW